MSLRWSLRETFVESEAIDMTLLTELAACVSGQQPTSDLIVIFSDDLPPDLKNLTEAFDDAVLRIVPVVFP